MPAAAPAVTRPSRRALLFGTAAAATLVTTTVGRVPHAAAAEPTQADAALHLVRRATWGPTTALVKKVRSQGTTAWLDQQLDPASISDPVVDGLAPRWSQLGLRTWECREKLVDPNKWTVMSSMVDAHLARALWSERQLFEVMVDVWNNHLVIPAPTSKVWDCAHLFQRDVVRKYALGKFSDMLTAAVRHPALLNVLDNALSSKKQPNENHGRELLELHTVGVGNYTESDVRQSTLALTGLSVDSESGLYEYKPQRRYVGTLKVLGWSDSNLSPESGEKVALAYVKYLAAHKLTATRIATKLAVRFISDTPPASIVDKLASTYLANDTSIAPVLKVLFTSDEFAASVGQKIRTPAEDTLASLRLLGAQPEATGTDDLRGLSYSLRLMGHVPMGCMLPSGYPDVAAAWASASGTLARWNFHIGLVSGYTLGRMTRPPLTDLLPATRPATYGDLFDALAERLLLDPLSAKHRATLGTYFAHDPSEVLKADAAILSWRLKELIALLLDSYNFCIR